jgi:hypothetical protein
MSDEILNFEEHRQRHDNPKLVRYDRCDRCGKMILATLLRCSECGVHFLGEAQDFLHSSEHPESK